MWRCGLTPCLIALAGCWSGSSPTTPAGAQDVPGALWSTPAKPWRTPFAIQSIAVDGNTVLAFGFSRVVRIDLATGAALGSVEVSTWHSSALRLPDGRLLIGLRAAGGVASLAILDPTTLTPKPLPFVATGTEAEKTLDVVIARLADGGIAIAGPHQPLAVVDPVTWKVRRRLDDGSLGRISAIDADDAHLYVVAENRPQVVDLATGTHAPLSQPAPFAAGIAARPGAVATSAIDTASLYAKGVDKPVEVPAHWTVALSPDGTRAATVTVADHLLHVWRVAGGKQVAAFDLGGMLTDGRPMIDFSSNTRVIVAAGSQIRAVDLAAGTVSPDGGAPGNVALTTVNDDGSALAVGTWAWSFIPSGTAVARPLGKRLAKSVAPGDPTALAAFVTTDSQAGNVVIVDAPGLVVRGSHPLPADPNGVWTSARGSLIVLGYDDNIDTRLLYAKDPFAELRQGSILIDDATVIDADPDSGTALIVLGGQLRAFDADEHPGPALMLPDCGDPTFASLERGGPRVFVGLDDQVWMWNRKTGARTAVLDLAGAAWAQALGPNGDVLLGDDGDLYVWSPATRELRTVKIAAEYHAAVSPNGKRIFLALANGATALLDTDALRAAVKPEPAAATAVVEGKACPGGDPYDHKEREPKVDPDDDGLRGDEDGGDGEGDP